MSEQMDALKKLYDYYTTDKRFDHLRAPGIKFVPGAGPLNPRLMIIGEAPGRMENAKGIPFVGKAGIHLNNLLLGIDIDPGDVFITNVVKYWPRSKADGVTRTPLNEEIEESFDYINEEVNIVNPTLVGLCGKSALKVFYPDKISIQSCHGKLLNDLFVPLYHPAVICYRPDRESEVRAGFSCIRTYLNSKVV